MASSQIVRNHCFEKAIERRFQGSELGVHGLVVEQAGCASQRGDSVARPSLQGPEQVPSNGDPLREGELCFKKDGMAEREVRSVPTLLRMVGFL